MTKVQLTLEALGLVVPDPKWTQSPSRRPSDCPRPNGVRDHNGQYHRSNRFVSLAKEDGFLLGEVYFAQALPGGPVKIGWGISASRRVAELHTVRGPRFRLLTMTVGSRRDESRIHRALYTSRKECRPTWGLHGYEFFWPTLDVCRVVAAFGGKLLIGPTPGIVSVPQGHVREWVRNYLEASP